MRKEKPIEIWKLNGAFVKSINFGDLDYDSDESWSPSSLGISYDWAELQTPQ